MIEVADVLGVSVFLALFLWHLYHRLLMSQGVRLNPLAQRKGTNSLSVDFLAPAPYASSHEPKAATLMERSMMQEVIAHEQTGTLSPLDRRGSMAFPSPLPRMDHSLSFFRSADDPLCDPWAIGPTRNTVRPTSGPAIGTVRRRMPSSAVAEAHEWLEEVDAIKHSMFSRATDTTSVTPLLRSANPNSHNRGLPLLPDGTLVGQLRCGPVTVPLYLPSHDVCSDEEDASVGLQIGEPIDIVASDRKRPRSDASPDAGLDLKNPLDNDAQTVFGTSKPPRNDGEHQVPSSRKVSLPAHRKSLASLMPRAPSFQPTHEKSAPKRRSLRISSSRASVNQEPVVDPNQHRRSRLVENWKQEMAL